MSFWGNSLSASTKKQKAKETAINRCKKDPKLAILHTINTQYYFKVVGDMKEKRKLTEGEDSISASLRRSPKAAKVASECEDDTSQAQDSSLKIKDVSSHKNNDAKKATLKICCWNVAGIKAWNKKNGIDYIKNEDADIVCLQETKCFEKDLPGEVTSLSKGGKLTKASEKDYYMYWCNGEKKGYSGVCLWTREKPLKVTNGIGQKQHDNEGRLITAEFEKFYLVTTYVPNSGKGLVRLDYRRTWNIAMKDHLNELNKKKPVILCGDLNVAHHEIDIANPKSNKRNAGFTDEEREDFTSLLDGGYIDSYRYLYPAEKGAYTYWTYMANARARNVGWRLDYFVLSKSLETNICDSEIRASVLGSDHCPIVLSLNI